MPKRGHHPRPQPARAGRPRAAPLCRPIPARALGQRQRVNIARALAREPRLAIPRRGGVGARQVGRGAGAEPAHGSGKEEFGLTYLFISHDLHVARYISDRVMVMYLGKVAETGPAGRRCSSNRCPIPGRCCRRCRRWTRPAHRGGRARRATCPTRSTRRRAAFRPAARSPRTVCSQRAEPRIPAAARTACRSTEPGGGHSHAAAVAAAVHRIMSGADMNTASQADSAPIVSVRDLRVTFSGGKKPVSAVNGVDLSVARRETVALIGESARARASRCARCCDCTPNAAPYRGPHRGRRRGRARAGQPARSPTIAAPRRLDDFQEPLLALDPVSVGQQIVESIPPPRAHQPRRGASVLELFGDIAHTQPRAPARRLSARNVGACASAR